VTKTRSYIIAAITVALLALAFVLPQLKSSFVGAAGETLTGSASFSGQAGVPIHITNLQISATGNPTLPITLRASQGVLALGTTTGLTFTGNQSGSTLEFSGTVANLNAALLTLTHQGSSVGSSTIEVSMVGAGEIFDPSNGHLYEFVNETYDWDGANTAAAARTKNGATGYLATITTADENEFVSSRLTGAGWMGAGDFGAEGDWKWVVGPEAGTSFWSGIGPEDGGFAVGGMYSSWSEGEPNQAGDEDCSQYLSTGGLWNDLPCVGTDLESYAVEYGAPGNLPSVAYKVITVNAQPVSFAGGNGTPQAPYQVTDCQRLQGMDQNLSASYVMTANVDCSETVGWNGGAGFNPIGNDGSPFTGTFNAQGYTIDALHIIRADDDQYTSFGSDPDTNEQFVGLFGNTHNATVQNLHVTNSKVKGFEFVGGIIGSMDGGTLSNVTFNIGVAGNDCDPGLCVWARYGQEAGGLVGHLTAGTISDSQSAGPVKGSGKLIGGLVGNMSGGILQDSSSSSDVDGGQYIGGAIGFMLGGTATRVHASGSVDANAVEDYKDGKYGGGFVGALEGGVISQSYATGDVVVEVGVGGGFVGVMFSNSANSISDAYATGDVTSVDGSNVGGFVGETYQGTITRAYASGSVMAFGNAGGFVANVYNAAPIHNSFAVGHVASTASSGLGGFIAEASNGVAMTHNFMDLTGTSIPGCGASVSSSACTAVNYNNTQPRYFVDLRNDPFTQNGTAIWDNSTVWYFDAVNLPVLRMGTNSTPSVVITDDDEDGISSAVENAGPFSGDGNNDGTLDSLQANVASFVSPVTNEYVTLAVSSACTINATSVASESSKSVADPGYEYPGGLVSYSIDCGTPGYTAQVTLYFHGLSSDSTIVRKYNSVTHTYGLIPNAVVTKTADYTSIAYSVKDGGLLDEDGIENGTIIDPAGLAVPFVAGAPNTGLQSISTLSIGLAIASGILLTIYSVIRLRRALTV